MITGCGYSLCQFAAQEIWTVWKCILGAYRKLSQTMALIQESISIFRKALKHLFNFTHMPEVRLVPVGAVGIQHCWKSNSIAVLLRLCSVLQMWFPLEKSVYAKMTPSYSINLTLVHLESSLLTSESTLDYQSF